MLNGWALPQEIAIDVVGDFEELVFVGGLGA